jgi:ElaB/YqjD/DUF883 family membrane-anchored ribosome-binding protein
LTFLPFFQDTIMFKNQPSDIAHSLMDQAGHSADVALGATQRMTNEAVEGAARSLQTASREIRNSAHHASDNTAAYVRHEPIKSILIAAAAGAALMALAHVIGSPRHPH